MEPIVHLDTHVVIWLYVGDRKRLRPVWRDLRASVPTISPMVIPEIQYLFEAGRISHSAETIVRDLVARVGLRVSDQSLARIVAHALEQRWTRDPFDRLIVGNALAEEAPLLSCDETILANCSSAKWKPPATEPPRRKVP